MYGGEGASRNTATFAVSRERRVGSALAITYQQNTVKISCKCGRVMATRCGYGAPQRPVALCAWAGQPYKILRKKIISQIGQRTAFTFTLRTAESYILSRRCMYGEKHHEVNNKNRCNVRAHRGSPPL